MCRECIRIIRENGFAVNKHRQTGVGLHHQRLIRHAADTLQKRQHLFAAKTAVQPQRADAQAVQHHCHGLHAAAGQQAAVDIRSRRRQNRQGSVLLRAENSGLHFTRIAHCLDDDDVRAGIFAECRYFAKQLDGFLKPEVAHGLKQPAGRADIKRDQSVSCFLHSTARLLNGTFHHAGKVAPQSRPVGAECVRGHHVCSGRQIQRMHTLHHIGMGEIPHFRHLSGL